MRITKRQLRALIREVSDQILTPDTPEENLPNRRIAFDKVASPDGTLYTISTINRESSSPAAYNTVYAETMVLAYKPRMINGKKYPNIVWQGEAGKDSRRAHDHALELVRIGKILDPNYSDYDNY